ncbi:hypothetical protein EGR_04812 [Echinococcus granulosus]|uniref:Uncharacterized protein n=1 Tax=Echinococcus granulosus TaxID=6210 RepID=W6V2R0_ECHGR|nr:hypothetical protein EGR_04812 [Echinococcus granulosus]EUB60254.1 hypothetical protein EGR_04812 [Echinococcus granulosus]
MTGAIYRSVPIPRSRDPSPGSPYIDQRQSSGHVTHCRRVRIYRPMSIPRESICRPMPIPGSSDALSASPCIHQCLDPATRDVIMAPMHCSMYLPRSRDSLSRHAYIDLSLPSALRGISSEDPRIDQCLSSGIPRVEQYLPPSHVIHHQEM